MNHCLIDYIRGKLFMPHIKLECSSNVKMDFRSFFEELSEKLVATGHASQMGIKCRVVAADTYYIIDGQTDYKMINLLFRLREGRSDEVLALFSKIGMDLLSEYLKEDIEAKKIILSTEIKELIKGRDLTQNAVR